jgi:hypothetical protein
MGSSSCGGIELSSRGSDKGMLNRDGDSCWIDGREVDEEGVASSCRKAALRFRFFGSTFALTGVAVGSLA